MRASLYSDKGPADIRMAKAGKMYDTALFVANNAFSGDTCEMFLTPRDLRTLARECLVMADELEES